MADPRDDGVKPQPDGGLPGDPRGHPPWEWEEPTLRGDITSWTLAALWGGSPIALKQSLEGNHPLRVGALRLAVGAAVVLLQAIVLRKSLLPHGRDWLQLLLMGLLFAGHTAAVHYGTLHTSASHASVIFGINPAIAMVLAHFLIPGDRLGRRSVAGTVIVYSGLIVVFSRHFSDPGVEVTGDFVMLVAAAALAVRQVSVARLSQHIEPVKIVFWEVLIALPVMFAAAMAFDDGLVEWHSELLVAMIYNGVLMAGTGLVVNTRLLQQFKPSRILSQQMVIPIFGVLFGWAILDEPVGVELGIGLAIVLVGFAISPRRPFGVQDEQPDAEADEEQQQAEEREPEEPSEEERAEQ